MRRLKRARPSPALIVAVVALVAALAGTAVASDPLATSSAKKVTKKKVKKIADRRINKLAPGLSVANAETAQNAETAETANSVVDGAITAPKLGTIVSRSSSVALNDGAGNAGNAACQPGEKMVGGGGQIVGPANTTSHMVSSRPTTGTSVPVEGDPLTEWRAAATNPAGGQGNTTLNIFALCLQ
jgi:hypothetical protein